MNNKNQQKMRYFLCCLFFGIWDDPISECTLVFLLSYGDRGTHTLIFGLCVCDNVFYKIIHILLFCCHFLSVYSFVLFCVVPLNYASHAE